MNDLNLTELEKTVLTTFIDGLYAEAGFSDVDAEDIARDTKMDIKVVRGVLGSLCKKHIIDVAEPNSDGYKIIYLGEKFYYLHPEWSKS